MAAIRAVTYGLLVLVNFIPPSHVEDTLHYHSYRALRFTSILDPDVSTITASSRHVGVRE